MAGTITLSGIGSGIDGASYASAVGDELRLQNEIHEQSIEQLESENSSLDTLKTLLLTLSDKLSAFNTLNGGALVNTASTSDSSVATAVAGTGSKAGSYTVTISSLATTATGSFGRSFASDSEAILSDSSDSGTIAFTVGSGDEATSFSVAVGPTTTAANFVDSFNEAADGTASASLVNLGTSENPQYVISFSSSSLGTEAGSLSVSVGNSGLSDALGTTTVSQATDAVFSVSGISGTFTRSSNTVSDAISGVTLQLVDEGTAQISVTQSSTASASQLESFVSAYNDLVNFINEEDAVTVTVEDGETTNVKGSLADTSVDDRLLVEIRSAIASANSSDGSVSLASLGISTERDGTLSFDAEAFASTFSKNPQATAEAITALADNLSGASGAIQQYTGYGLAIDTAISANNQTIGDLEETISQVEETASAREEAILKQFTSLESLLAKLNTDSSLISTLLDF